MDLLQMLMSENLTLVSSCFDFNKRFSLVNVNLLNTTATVCLTCLQPFVLSPVWSTQTEFIQLEGKKIRSSFYFFFLRQHCVFSPPLPSFIVVTTLKPTLCLLFHSNLSLLYIFIFFLSPKARKCLSFLGYSFSSFLLAQDLIRGLISSSSCVPPSKSSGVCRLDFLPTGMP